MAGLAFCAINLNLSMLMACKSFISAMRNIFSTLMAVWNFFCAIRHLFYSLMADISDSLPYTTKYFPKNIKKPNFYLHKSQTLKELVIFLLSTKCLRLKLRSYQLKFLKKTIRLEFPVDPLLLLV